MTLPNADAFRILVAKAQRALDACQQKLAQAHARREQLQASLVRLQTMMAEYRQRQTQSMAEGQLMADSLNQRQFIAQLQQLMDQAMRAVSQADGQCAQFAQAVIQAQLEVDKAQKIYDQSLAAARLHASRVEQKRMDDLAVMRHPFRQGLSHP
jgi:flagellar export protein FliJ